MMQRFEKLLGPVKSGDGQVHKQSLVDQFDILLVEGTNQGRQDYPGKDGWRYNGYTYEIVPDGANVKHYNLTVHYTSDKPTLNPRNLNQAPETFFGNTLDDEEKRRRGVGLKEGDIRTIGR